MKNFLYKEKKFPVKSILGRRGSQQKIRLIFPDGPAEIVPRDDQKIVSIFRVDPHTNRSFQTRNILPLTVMNVNDWPRDSPTPANAIVSKLSVLTPYDKIFGLVGNNSLKKYMGCLYAFVVASQAPIKIANKKPNVSY